MSQQDLMQNDAQGTHAADLWGAFRELIGERGLAEIRFRADCTWTATTLSFAALLWAWSDQRNLTDHHQDAGQIIQFLGITQAELTVSYQAFLKLLRKWTPALRAALTAIFRHCLQTKLPGVWRVAGWCVFAVDGSRVGVPRTRGNEACFCSRSRLSRAAQQRRNARRRQRNRVAAARAAKAAIPRIWLTALWHVGSSLVWDWRSGAADSSERTHL